MHNKNLLIYVFLLLTLSGCAQHKKKPAKKATVNKTQQKKPAAKTPVKQKPIVKARDTDTAILTNKADSIVSYAKKFLSVKYRYGGEDTLGFDCAGFVSFVYRRHGIKLPRTADAQALLGKEVNRQTMRPGDLVYFKGRDLKSKSIGHVGIVTARTPEKIYFISATVSAGIHIDDLDGTYWKERFVIAKRILVSK